VGDFQNPDFPELFARYAQAFAARFPWVQFYTPVNEMFICALFSAKYGWWNERLRSDRAFVRALCHIVEANVLAMQSILRVRNDGVPIVGFTWFSLTDQYDWDSALCEQRGHIDAVGLYDLQRKPRAVGRAYRELIAEWRAVLPTQSVVLAIPARPSDSATG